jgi:hypothetical protein
MSFEGKVVAVGQKEPASVTWMVWDHWHDLDVSPSLKGVEIRLIWVKGEGVALQ